MSHIQDTIEEAKLTAQENKKSIMIQRVGQKKQ
jgi:hypothetical protein